MSPTEVTYFWQKSNLGDAPISPYIVILWIYISILRETNKVISVLINDYGFFVKVSPDLLTFIGIYGGKSEKMTQVSRVLWELQGWQLVSIAPTTIYYVYGHIMCVLGLTSCYRWDIYSYLEVGCG